MREMVGDAAVFGVLTVSDRASRGEYVDESGPEIIKFLKEAVVSNWTHFAKCVSDDKSIISSTLVEMVDDLGCDVIVTTGGTGPAIRDVTPEATSQICDRILPGFGEQMRAISLNYVPTAILSRQLGGTRNKSLIFNLPGRPKAIRETINEIWKSVPYCVDLLGGPYIVMDRDVCQDFRPKNARRNNT